MNMHECGNLYSGGGLLEILYVQKLTMTTPAYIDVFIGMYTHAKALLRFLLLFNKSKI